MLFFTLNTIKYTQQEEPRGKTQYLYIKEAAYRPT